MAKMYGVVYDPPRDGLPILAVIFAPDGEVLTARVVPSISAGEDLIRQAFSKITTDSGQVLGLD